MKRIALFCVSYESDNELEKYLQSVDRAAKKAAELIHLDIFAAKNTKENNPGYFGAVSNLMQKAAIETYDYSIISNVDLTIEDDFFIKLAAYEYPENTGWIAPQIWSEKEMRDMNPKITNRYPRKKLQLLRFMHRFPILHAIYSKTLYFRKRNQECKSGYTYAGHGSFIILTKEYFKKCGIINYPIFLFCEEIYLAELCREAGLKVVYNPELRIIDNEHISTGKMPIRVYSRLNYEAVSYILKRFY